MILLFKVNSRHPFLIAQQVIDILIIRKRLHHIIYRSRIPVSYTHLDVYKRQLK